MVLGRKESQATPILQAIADCEEGTTGEIRVFLSKRPWEKDAYGRAMRIFKRMGMTRTSDRNAVLFYLNLRTRHFAIVADEGFQKVVESQFWNKFSEEAKRNLLSTQAESAIAITLHQIGEVLRKHFPKTV
jgi:uncharacterized membrane protein